MTQCFEVCRQQERLLRPKEVTADESLSNSFAQLPISPPADVAAALISDKANDDSIVQETDTKIAEEIVPPCPPNHCTVDELVLFAVCGTCDFNRIVIPTYTPEGEYVFEVTDNVSDGIITTCALIPKDADSITGVNTTSASTSVAPIAISSPSKPALEVTVLEPLPVKKMKDSVRVVTALPVSRQLKFKVVKSL